MSDKQRFNGLILCSLFVTIFCITPPSTHAGQPLIWQTGTRAELLKGESHGVSISDTGALMLAPALTQLFNTEQPYVWSTATDDKGNVYLGTGHDGRIYR